MWSRPRSSASPRATPTPSPSPWPSTTPGSSRSRNCPRNPPRPSAGRSTNPSRIRTSTGDSSSARTTTNSPPSSPPSTTTIDLPPSTTLPSPSTSPSSATALLLKGTLSTRTTSTIGPSGRLAPTTPTSPPESSQPTLSADRHTHIREDLLLIPSLQTTSAPLLPLSTDDTPGASPHLPSSPSLALLTACLPPSGTGPLSLAHLEPSQLRYPRTDALVSPF
mmetsp:Transcript_6977/g.21268  ORF Transcript_6977/g.21268 Transcript_6977/m.21268 type:complete len:221 (+) Transcript_6977:518-1180(+)